MTYVVTESCIRCKYTDCVDVCPVDCFHEGANMLVIHPDECIDCGVCEPECPVDAIISDRNMTDEQMPFLALNAELAALWPIINEKKDPARQADQWQAEAGKIQYLDRSPAAG